jgi:hypothetical protein
LAPAALVESAAVDAFVGSAARAAAVVTSERTTARAGEKRRYAHVHGAPGAARQTKVPKAERGENHLTKTAAGGFHEE